MERDFMGVAGNERQRAAEDEGGRKESAYFEAGGVPPMDWSFASRAGAAPAVMSFRSTAREEQGHPQFSSFDGAKKQQTSRVLTQQRSFGAQSHGSPQYAATRGSYGGQQPQQQHVVNGVFGGQPPQQQHHQQQRQHQQQNVVNGDRVSSPFNPNSQMFKVQSSPNLPNGVAAGGQFKQPPFAVNNAVPSSRVGVYARNMPKPKMAQLTIFYAGSVNVFNNVSAEKAQEIMLLASRGSLPSASSTVARSPDANFFAPAKAAAPEVSPTTQMLPQKQQLFSPPASGISKQISSMSQAACLPRSSSSSNSDPAVSKSSGQLVVPPMSHSPSTRPVTLASSGHLNMSPMSQPQSTRPVTLASSGHLSMSPMSQPQSTRPVTLASSSHLNVPPMTQPPSTRPVTSSGQMVVPTMSQPMSTRPVTLASSGKMVMPPTSQPPSNRPVTLAATSAAAIMPRAVPQARKASLARFLEKRKERVTTVAPYQSAKSPMDSNDTVGSANDNSKSSCTGIAFSSNRDNSLCLGRPRNIISFSGECPSTNLHI